MLVLAASITQQTGKGEQLVEKDLARCQLREDFWSILPVVNQQQMPWTPGILSSAHVRLASWARVWVAFCVAKCPDISPQDLCTSCFFPEYSSLYHTGLISLLPATFPSRPNMSDLPLHRYLWVSSLAHHSHYVVTTGKVCAYPCRP